MKPLLTTRPRELLYRHGSGALTLDQAVSLIIGTGVAGHTVHEVSLQLADMLKAGDCTVEALGSVPGVGPAKASALLAALSLSRLVSGLSLSEVLIGPEAVFQACDDLLREPQEHLVTFFLSVRNHKIRRELISIGTATSSVVHAREVFRAAIVHNAHSLILAHNHPSGEPHPSSADCRVTGQLAQAGKVLGIEVLDHVICATGGWYSLKEHVPHLFP